MHSMCIWSMVCPAMLPLLIKNRKHWNPVTSLNARFRRGSNRPMATMSSGSHVWILEHCLRLGNMTQWPALHGAWCSDMVIWAFWNTIRFGLSHSPGTIPARWGSLCAGIHSGPAAIFRLLPRLLQHPFGGLFWSLVLHYLWQTQCRSAVQSFTKVRTPGSVAFNFFFFYFKTFPNFFTRPSIFLVFMKRFWLAWWPRRACFARNQGRKMRNCSWRKLRFRHVLTRPTDSRSVARGLTQLFVATTFLLDYSVHASALNPWLIVL